MAPTTPTTIELPTTVTLNPSVVGTLHLVVGAGGTGARLAIQLVKLLTPADAMLIFDQDIVEARNLLRQHFVQPDVGRNKAEVLAERLALAAPQGARVVAVPEHFAEAKHKQRVRQFMGTQTEHGARSLVIYGCVDNMKARGEMWTLFNSIRNEFNYQPVNVVYLDCGNAMRSGQVVINMNRCFGEITDGIGQLGKQPAFVTFDGFAELMPGFMKQKDEDDATEACAVRLDTQSLAANQWAATIAGTMASWVVDCLPFNVGGMTYSTLGSVTAAPFKGTVTNRGQHEVYARTLQNAHGGRLRGADVVLTGMRRLL